MTLNKRIAAAIAAGTLLAATLLPGAAFAARTCTITDNGAHSTNTCRIKVENSRKIVQVNKAFVKNVVVTISSTGGNEAEKNTGGDVTITSGDSTTTVRIINILNANVIIPPPAI